MRKYNLGASTKLFSVLTPLMMFLSGCNISVSVEGGFGDVRSSFSSQLAEIWCDEEGEIDCNYAFLGDPLFLSGTKSNVVLEATPDDPNFAFDRWTGSCAKSDTNTCTLRFNLLNQGTTAIFSYIGGNQAIGNLNFPNADVVNCLEETADNNGWTTSEQITELHCTRTDTYITKLNGIEALVNLDTLYIEGYCAFLGNNVCSNPEITDFTPLKYTAVTNIDIYRHPVNLLPDQEPWENKSIKLPSFPNVTSFRLVNYGLKPEMPSFSQMPNLVSLDVSENEFTTMYNFIRKVKSTLQTLQITETSIPCSEFDSLFAKVPNLVVNGVSDTASLNCLIPEPEPEPEPEPTV